MRHAVVRRSRPGRRDSRPRAFERSARGESRRLGRPCTQPRSFRPATRRTRSSDARRSAGVLCRQSAGHRASARPQETRHRGGGGRSAAQARRPRPLVDQHIRCPLAPPPGRPRARPATLLHIAARSFRAREARPSCAARPSGAGLDRRVAASSPPGLAGQKPCNGGDPASLGCVPGGHRPRTRARRGRLRLDGRRPEAGREARPRRRRRNYHERSAYLYDVHGVKRVSLLLSILAGLAVARARASLVAAAADPPAAIPLGVTMGGVQVGGLTPEAAEIAVEQGFQAPVELQLGSTRILVTPDVLGATPVLDKAIERALVAEPNSAVPLGVSVVYGAPAAFISTLAKRYDVPAVDSKLFLRHLRPWLSKERAGRKLDQRQAVRDVGAAVTGSVTRTPVTLTPTTVRPKLTRANFGPVIVIRRSSNELFLYPGMHYRRLFPVATVQHQYPTRLC